MSPSIQENEMYVVGKYCLENIKEFNKVFSDNTGLFNNTIKDSHNKIQSEKNQINVLNDKKSRSFQYISDNENRLVQIPLEISNLREDIKYCENEIDNTKVPVYTYKCNDDYCWKEIDTFQTKMNEMYIQNMRNRINNDMNEIDFLNCEIQRCKNNIVNLNIMIKNIESCIAQKECLINKIQKNIDILNKSYLSFKEIFEKATKDFETLNKKVLNAVDYIHQFGTTMAMISYSNMKLSYNNNSMFFVISNDLTKEIKIIEDEISCELENIRNCAKELEKFKNMLKDNISEQTENITIAKLFKIKEINKEYNKNVKFMKNALNYLISYETIRF